MKRKRYVAILLAGTMAVGSMAVPVSADAASEIGFDAASQNLPVDEEGNLSPFGKYAEPVTVEVVQSINPTQTLPEGNTATDNYFTKYIKENMNVEVKVKWQAAAADYNQKLNLAISSNDLPDILVVGDQELRKLIDSDLIEDLGPYYEQFASDYIKDDIAMTNGMAMKAVTVDGKMYGLPNAQSEGDGYNLMWIRQDWLDELDLEAPTTMEELETVAKAFVDNNMGGENTIGILGPTMNSRMYNDFMSSSNNMNNLDGIFQAYKSWPGFWVEDENGNVVYGSTTEQTKEALGELQKMYADGLLDQELGVRKDADEAWKGGKAGILFSPWWNGYSMGPVHEIVPEADWKAYAAPLAEDGQWYPKLGKTSGSYCVVRKGYEHPEVAILLNNYLRRYESVLQEESNNMSLDYYPGRVVLTKLDEIAFTAECLLKKLNGEEIPEYDPLDYKLLDLDLEAVTEVLEAPYDDLSIEKWDTTNANFGRVYSMVVGAGAIAKAEETVTVNKIYSQTYAQTETMLKRWTNLKKKEDETFLKIIIGEESLDAFDTFVEEWNAEGGEEITAEVQALVNQ